MNGKRSEALKTTFRSAAALAFALSLAAAIPVSAGPENGPGNTMRGVPVTRPVPRSLESGPKTHSAPRAKPMESPFHRRALNRPSSVPVPPPSDPAPFPEILLPESYRQSLAPLLDDDFPGIGDDRSVIPPDTMGAAGPFHLVSFLNSEVGVFSRAGTLLQKIKLDAFWAGIGTDNEAISCFDPKVLHDPHSGRFIAVTLRGKRAPDSWVLIAVSPSDSPSPSPLSSWVKVSIEADNTAQTWADYPGLGVDAENIYVTANLFNNLDQFRHAKVWVVPKAQLLSGLPGTLAWIEFRDPLGSDFTMQPAVTYGTPGAQYFVWEWGTAGSNGSLRIGSITPSGGGYDWNVLGNVQSVAPYTLSYSFPAGAPQPGGTADIHIADTRLLNAVHRNGTVWTTHTVMNSTGTRSEVAWYQIDPAALRVVKQGRVGDPVRWYYYPSIAVNRDDTVALGMSGSSPFEFAGGFYSAFRYSDLTPTSVSRQASLLKPGEAYYEKTATSGNNRWGDFSATVVDPTDDVTFWTLQEYAETPAGSTSLWGTWWGTFRPPAITAPGDLAGTSPSPTEIALSWTNPVPVPSFYTVERRVAAGGSPFSAIAGVSLPGTATSYTDNNLSAGTTYIYRLKADLSGNAAYSNEATATASGPPPPPSGGGGGGCAAVPGGGRTGPDVPSGPLCLAIAVLIPWLLRIRESFRAGRSR